MSHMHQSCLDKHVYCRYKEDQGLGSVIDKRANLEAARIIFQNPRGIMKCNPYNEYRRDRVDDNLVLEQLCDLNTDILCITKKCKLEEKMGKKNLDKLSKEKVEW